jgi:hypothetical protein
MQPPFLYYATALVDEQLKQVVLDFSNTPQFTTGGAVQENRDLQLAIATSSGFTILGKINYAAPDWYMGTSGICTFPLTDEQLTAALQNPLGSAKCSYYTQRCVYTSEHHHLQPRDARKCAVCSGR